MKKILIESWANDIISVALQYAYEEIHFVFIIFTSIF